MAQEEFPPTSAGRDHRRMQEAMATGGDRAPGDRLLALTLNLAGNGRTGLWDRDEPRYAVCVREMRARGDWIFPTFNGDPRYHKPILIYWLMGLTTAFGGDNPFGVATGLVARRCGYRAGRLVVGPADVRSHAAAAWLRSIMATAPIAVAESKLATTDATLALWLLGCQACLWVLGRRASHAAAALFWVFLSLATLTKGPIGPVLIAVGITFRLVLRLAALRLETAALAAGPHRVCDRDGPLVHPD